MVVLICVACDPRHFPTQVRLQVSAAASYFIERVSNYHLRPRLHSSSIKWDHTSLIGSQNSRAGVPVLVEAVGGAAPDPILATRFSELAKSIMSLCTNNV